MDNRLKALGQIEDLPTLPIIVRQVQQLINNPRSNMGQIATVIMRDQAISSKVVKLVNSAFYGLRSRVSSIRQAIVVLGLNTVKNLVLGVSVVKTFSKNKSASIFDREKFWLHAFECAMVAKALATHLGREEPEDYFLAGLLHDIGILVMDQFLHEDFVEILKSSVQDRVDYFETERKKMSYSHNDVGAFVGKKWELPEHLIHAMQHHHEPALAIKQNDWHPHIIAVTHLADVLSLKKGFGRFVQFWEGDCDPEALRFLEIDRSLLDGVIADAKKEVRPLMKEWGV